MDFSDDDNNFGIGTIDDEYEDEAIDAGFNEKLLHDESIDSKSDVETDSEEEFPSESSSLSSEGYGRGVVQHVDVSANVYGRGRGRGRGKSVVFETPSEEFVVPPNPQGRGRYGTIDPGGGSQSLVSPMSDESSSKMRKAKLHPRFYEKRMDPEDRRQFRRQRRAPTQLIDFESKFTEIAIVTDKDDSEEKGFRHACRILKDAIGDLPQNLSKTSAELWIFGLYKYSIRFEHSFSCDLMKLFPEKFDQEENRPFWFLFSRPMRFEHPSLKIQTSQLTEPKNVTMENGVVVDLSYGASTSMCRFYVDRRFRFRKRDRWTFRFANEFVEIQSVEFPQNDLNSPRILRSVKRRIPVDLVDRSAIFYLWNDGFALFIHMKGNLHEFHRDFCSKDSRKSDNFFLRQGLNNEDRARPLFSTIRLRVFLKGENDFSTAFERFSKKLNDDEKSRMTEDQFRLKSLDQIRDLFKNFLDFFYRNSIRVCFGSISSGEIAENRLATIFCHRFRTFVQNYSFEMLLSQNLRLQVHFIRNDQSILLLNNYAEPEHVDETEDQIDDRFYRLCIYLYRRSSEYFFLDLVNEIQVGIDEHREKRRGLRFVENSPIRSDASATSTAYIPSVVLTPTTILIRPLKLCKLNRVLREPRFGGFHHFALVELRDEAQRLLFASPFRALNKQILKYLTKGFEFANRSFRYLHHSQSQVKSKQFWFYSAQPGFLSHNDAYAWMGNFDKERIVAKHTARIALCFTSSDRTIQIPAEQVTYARDVKKGDYVFSDGVGTISAQLRDKIGDFLHRRDRFSVIQIRYGGSKGTVSVDPRLDNQKYQLVIRDSMNKFTSDHDILEVCKLSAPRCLYLNRQDIVLMESRDVPDANFLLLQNDNHLWLIRSLLQSGITFEVLQEKILPVFRLRSIARHIDLVREPFFMNLVTTCASNIINELLDRTRIRVSPNTARNMFGIMDEYGVLESGEVFFQYTEREMLKIDKFKEVDETDIENDNENEIEHEVQEERRVIPYEGPVVVTKNPCHHPGDLRVFQAVYHPRLAHLKDVIVFPQKGDRPHSNEISGSDLDGDEYVVIWLKSLIPCTPNESAYNYDSQGDPPKMDHPITRDEIIQIVMEVSEQDCLGTLSNIHLAYADKIGIKSEKCKKLAGDISQEVDAAKTGRHPLSEDEIRELRNGLDEKWPDFMCGPGQRNFYPSERILGKLYRSGRRAANGWRRAMKNNLESKSIDEEIHHPDAEKYLSDVKFLYKIYRNELLEIISVYRFKDEIDLFCRSDTTDASGGGARLKKGALEDSAANEVKSLISRISQSFFAPFKDKRATIEEKLAKAACLYRYTYEQSYRRPTHSNRRIFSLPWFFSKYLIALKYRNRSKETIDRSRTLIGEAFAIYPLDFVPQYRFDFDDDGHFLTFFLKENRRKIERVEFIRGYFLQVLTDWLTRQNIFGETFIETIGKPLIPQRLWWEIFVKFLTNEFDRDFQLFSSETIPRRTIERYQSLIGQIRLRWTHVEYEEFHELFRLLLQLVKETIEKTKETRWTYLQEYLLLALQSIAIERRLVVEQWIFS